MKRYLDIAAKAWAKATLNVQRFANAYVEAVGEFGDEAIEGFRSAYPMFGDREWRRLGQIGSGQLLPHFFMKSDSFVGKLLNLNSSMRIQKALVGASNDGRIRIDRGNGPEKVRLADLTAREDKALIMLLSEENEKLSSSELRLKYRTLVAKVNKSNRHETSAWDIRIVNGRAVAHFNRACNMDRSDLEEILECVKRGQDCPAVRTRGEILKELVDSIVELEGLRDDEWDFEENHDRHFWTDEEEAEHSTLLNDIQRCRNKVRDLAREATEDAALEL